MKSITLKEVEYLAFQLAKEHLSFDEPIPDFSTRFANVLESCIAMPFMKFDGKALYKNLTGRAVFRKSSKFRQKSVKFSDVPTILSQNGIFRCRQLFRGIAMRQLVRR